MIEIDVKEDVFKLAETFTISRGSRTEAKVLTVELRDGPHRGYGECVPYARYNETLASVTEQIHSSAQALRNNPTPEQLLNILPAGAARNAVDCALWDLLAKREQKPVWQLMQLDAPRSVTTVYTLSLAEPEVMHRKAIEHAARPILKLKLGGEGDLERLRAVRAGAPNTKIVVDANEGWTEQTYLELAPVLLELGVAMVEQPLPAAADDALLNLDRTLPVCADESCHDTSTLASLQGKYDMVNIKLDKTGGLTEAMRVKQQAVSAGFDLMVGCMVGSSLAMAPGMLVAQGVGLVDLDGPLLLAEDREVPLVFQGSVIEPPDARLWG